MVSSCSSQRHRAAPAGITPPEGRVLDGISLLPVLRREMSLRPVPLGFWNAGIPGQFTNPMGIKKVLPTNENWSDSKIERVTKRVEKLPRKEFPKAGFPGHSAWISGDWKLHRIALVEGVSVNWRLYNLRNDPGERIDPVDTLDGVGNAAAVGGAIGDGFGALFAAGWIGLVLAVALVPLLWLMGRRST